MAIKDLLPRLRKDRGLTQEALAAKLYVTRQAISRWENGETLPSIDMTKLLAITLNVPVSYLLEMPEQYCQSCGKPLYEPSMHGTELDGTLSREYCSCCYQHGSYTFDVEMDDMIEGCAPFVMKETGLSREESVSFLGALLPNLKRWSTGY